MKLQLNIVIFFLHTFLAFFLNEVGNVTNLSNKKQLKKGQPFSEPIFLAHILLKSCIQ